VLDADNVMAPGFLEQVARSVADGACVVQGRRVAKNHDTALARLDGVSEAINNEIFRRGHRALGLSAALIGSGMVLEMDLLRRLMAAIDTPDGFDKDIELRLLRAGIRIEYAPDAVVYDEKVRADAVFVEQRRRWIGAQARYLRRHFAEGLRVLAQGGPLDYVDKVVQMLLPPRALLLAMLPALAVANAAVGSVGWAGTWAGLTALLAAGLVVAVPADREDLSGSSLFYALPRGVWLGLRAFFRSREELTPNTTTPHHASEVSAPSS
jgi:cellulose synthase/poly-beta-1,6-N-acetylglucosamine synthase-like glycosyltransferase